MKYKGTFKRREKKYRLTREQHDILLSRLSEYMEEDEYGVHTICSIYYETDNFQIIRNSLQKPPYKEKLRLRSYGVQDADQPVYMELKKKFKGTVYKRRVAVNQEDAFRYLEGNIPEDGCQILREIDWFLNFYNPKPCAFVACERRALFSRENSELRVTFDYDIRCRDRFLDFSHGTSGDRIMHDGEVLMEIKIPGAMPVWLSKILNALKIYPVSFSKYGEYYKQYLLEGMSYAG